MTAAGRSREDWWDEASIRWFKSASAHTGFHKALARVLRPYLRDSSTLCDIACGLGLIDLELAGDLDRITCVDISTPAIDSLGQEAEDRGIMNLDPRLMSWEGLTGRWDTVLLCHFGSKEMEAFLPLCRELLCVLSVGSQTLGPAAPPSKEGREDRADAAFSALGLPWTKERVTLEFGQPLLSRADAEAFARRQCPRAARAEVGAYLDQTLIALDHPIFPCYLPHPKELAIYHLKQGI